MSEASPCGSFKGTRGVWHDGDVAGDIGHDVVVEGGVLSPMEAARKVRNLRLDPSSLFSPPDATSTRETYGAGYLTEEAANAGLQHQ